LLPNFYKSPSQCRLITRVENKLRAADDSWWTGRFPLHTRVVDEVPLALYLNYVARKSYFASLAPRLFRPLDLPGKDLDSTHTALMSMFVRTRMNWRWC
jgi:hypothetical protein